jgi:uncharacterized SAM-binding protein YcdF (DUF218 family)
MDVSTFTLGLSKETKLALDPLAWLLLLLSFLLFLVIREPSARRLRSIRFIAASAWLLVFFSSSPLIARMFVSALEEWHSPFDHLSPQRFDAIVVLAGGAFSKGNLRPTTQLTSFSMERTLCGIDLFVKGLAPRLVFVGGRSSQSDPGLIEAVEMKRFAERLGIPTESIVVDDRSRNTYENAVEARRLLGDASVLLVTSAFHMPRAVGLFRNQGLRVSPHPCGYLLGDRPEYGWAKLHLPDLLPQTEALRTTRLAINEIIAIVVYWALGKFS